MLMVLLDISHGITKATFLGIVHTPLHRCISQTHTSNNNNNTNNYIVNMEDKKPIKPEVERINISVENQVCFFFLFKKKILKMSPKKNKK